MCERGHVPATVPTDDRLFGRIDNVRADDAYDRCSAVLSTADRYVIAHDIVDRLTAIIGWSDLLQRRLEAGLDPEATLHGLATIQSSAEDVAELFAEFRESRQLGPGPATRLRRAGFAPGRAPR